MITLYKRTVKNPELLQLASPQTGIWIHAIEPTGQELDRLARDFSLERDLLADAMDPYEVPRVEREGSVTYIYARVPHRNGTEESTSPIMVAIGSSFFLTVSQQEIPLWDRFLNEEIDFYSTQKTKFFSQIITEINRTYRRFLTEIEKQVWKARVNLEHINNRDIVQFVTYESILIDFLAALAPTNTLLENLLSGKMLPLYAGDQDMIEDLFLSNGQLMEAARQTKMTIGNIRDAYTTVSSQNLNQVIKLFTSLTVVMTIPTMIFSLYGMNIPLPFADHEQAFAIVTGSTTLLVVVVLFVFYKKEWL